MERHLDPETQRLIKESNDLVWNFQDSKSALIEGLQGHIYVLLPTDNPALAAYNLEQAKRYEVKNFSKILKISASREAPDKPYTVFSTLQSEEQLKPN